MTMAREIKFRGKTEDGKWIYGSLVQFYGKTYIWQNDTQIHVAQGMIPVQSDTVGQYIGWKDNKGKEIYEGDIVLDIDGKKYVLKHMDYGFDCVAVGNIHDNPELL